MSETNAPSVISWLRWGLLAAVVIAGLVLLLILGAASSPVVRLDGTLR